METQLHITGCKVDYRERFDILEQRVYQHTHNFSKSKYQLWKKKRLRYVCDNSTSMIAILDVKISGIQVKKLKLFLHKSS